MTMKQAELKERLNTIRIFNTWDLLIHFGEERSTDVCVSYRGRGDSRSMHVPQTQVWSPNYKTDPDGRWYNNGNKTFLGHRPESMPLALDWAAEHCPAVLIWVTCPFDRMGKVPAQVVTAAIAKVKAAG